MRKQKAQNLTEYTICVAAIILATIVMQSYIRRGVQGRYRDVVDYTTAQLGNSGRRQYEPNYLNEDFTLLKDTNIQMNKEARGAQTSRILQDQTTRDGTSIEEINPYVER